VRKLKIILAQNAYLGQGVSGEERLLFFWPIG
jgi:hypothetical protein